MGSREKLLEVMAGLAKSSVLGNDGTGDLRTLAAEHRDRFAEEMTELLNVEVQPVASPEAVVKGSDIVMCATNSSQPVFDGNWLEPGQLVTTIANTDGVHRRTEADAATMMRSDFIVLNNRETAITNQQRELLDLIDQGKFAWDKVCELGEVLIGRHPGRKTDRQRGSLWQ